MEKFFQKLHGSVVTLPNLRVRKLQLACFCVSLQNCERKDRRDYLRLRVLQHSLDFAPAKICHASVFSSHITWLLYRLGGIAAALRRRCLLLVSWIGRTEGKSEVKRAALSEL